MIYNHNIIIYNFIIIYYMQIHVMWMYIPQDLSWKLKMMISKRHLLFQRFHVQLPSLNCRGLPCLADLGDGIPIPSLNHWTAVKQLWPPGRNGEKSWSDDRNPVSIMIEQPHSKPTNIARKNWRLLISSEYQFPTKKSAQLRINNYSHTLPYLTLHHSMVSTTLLPHDIQPVQPWSQEFS